MRQGSPGDLWGIGQQHPQARNAQIGNAEMAPARARWRGGRGVRSRPTRLLRTPFCCGVSLAHPWRVSGRSKRDLAAPASCRTRCSARARVRLRPISAHGRIWPTALCSGRAGPVLWPTKPAVPPQVARRPQMAPPAMKFLKRTNVRVNKFYFKWGKASIGRFWRFSRGSVATDGPTASRTCEN